MTWYEIRDKLIAKYPKLLPDDIDKLMVDTLTDFCSSLYEAGIKRGQELAAIEIRKILERLEEMSALKRGDE